LVLQRANASSAICSGDRPGVGLVGEDADHGIAALAAVHDRDAPPSRRRVRCVRLVTERLRVREIDDGEGRRLARIIHGGSGWAVTFLTGMSILTADNVKLTVSGPHCRLASAIVPPYWRPYSTLGRGGVPMIWSIVREEGGETGCGGRDAVFWPLARCWRRR
jgi:hypothetical protein